jgi:hypothetical protein
MATTASVKSVQGVRVMSIIESDVNLLDRLVAVVPEHYREELAHLGQRLRAQLPPNLVKQRVDLLEQHLDARLGAIEAKLDGVLQRLDATASQRGK